MPAGDGEKEGIMPAAMMEAIDHSVISHLL